MLTDWLVHITNIFILTPARVYFDLQEKMCEESTSFDLTPYDLTSAIDAVDKVLKEQVSDIGKEESSEDFNVESLNSGLADLWQFEYSIKQFWCRK